MKMDRYRKRRSKHLEEENFTEQDYLDRYINGENFNQKISPLRPKKKQRRLVLKIFAILMLIVVGTIGGFLWRLNNSFNAGLNHKSDLLFNGKASANGANNILIMGTDQRKEQGTGASRADSIMVVQLDSPNGKPKIISFMRDCLVDIPNVGTPGYTDCKINAAYGIGEQGDKNGQNKGQGVELMRQTLKNNFGIDCKYFAIVNFDSFAKVVDKMFPNGVKINANFGTIAGAKVSEVGVPDDLNAKSNGFVPEQKIKVGQQNMDGRTLLNYARFRHDDDNDFGRVKRQQQVLTAISTQAKDNLLKTVWQTPETIATVLEVTSTNLDRNFLKQRLFSVFFSGIGNFQKLSVPSFEETGTYQEGCDLYGGQGLDLNLDYYRQKVAKFLG